MAVCKEGVGGIRLIRRPGWPEPVPYAGRDGQRRSGTPGLACWCSSCPCLTLRCPPAG